jgi:hypothetical protein
MSAGDFIHSAEEIAAHPSFDDLRFIINDYTGVEGNDVDADAIELIAAIRFGSSLTNPDVRVLVVSADPSLLDLVKAVGQPPLEGSNETVAFPSMQLAKAWILEQPASFSIRRCP